MTKVNLVSFKKNSSCWWDVLHDNNLIRDFFQSLINIWYVQYELFFVNYKAMYANLKLEFLNIIFKNIFNYLSCLYSFFHII